MNTINNSHIPDGLSSETIANFAFLTPDSLTALCDALSLKMGLAELRFCQNHFKLEKRSDPTVDELKIIDRVFYDRSRKADSYLVASFMTDDKTVADTYADLMARRRAVNRDYNAPCSILEMLGVMPQYIKLSSGNKIPDVKLFSGKSRAIDALSQHYRKTISNGNGNTDAIIGVKAKNSLAVTPTAGDALYAVLKSFNDSLDFNKTLEDFVSSREVSNVAKRITALDDRCVITALSELNSGIKLNILPYESKSTGSSPFSHLADSDCGVIISASKGNAADMLISAQDMGLRVILLGVLDNSRKIDALSNSWGRLSLDLGLLNTLKFSRVLSCEADGAKRETTACESSIYVGINGNRYKFSGASYNSHDAFMSGFNSVLYSYSLTIAGGENDVIGAGAYTLPLNAPTKKSMGEALELILGAYRAQCELGICDFSPTVEIGERAELKFHTLSRANGNIPAKICEKDSYIFYLEPVYNENRLPDFDDLKKMHSYIGRLMNDGTVLSIRPTGEDLIATLDKMSQDTCVEYLGREDIKSHVGGFIVQTTQKIEGELIAKTVSKSLGGVAQNAEISV